MRPGFNPLVGKIPWEREWLPTPIFLPGESPWTEEPGGLQSMGHKESDTTKHSTFLVFLFFIFYFFASSLWAVCMFWRLNPCDSFANILSHFVGCLFILFMVSFAVQKFLSLIRSHLIIFVFISIILGDRVKNILQFMSKNVLPVLSSRSFIVHI